jgi:hypothetical protein
LSLLLGLLLLGADLSSGVSMDPACYFLVQGVDWSEFGCFLFNPSVDQGAAVPHFLVDPVLDHQELSHHKALDASTHKVEGKTEDQIEEEKYFETALTLVDPPFVEPDHIAVLVDGGLWHF